MHVSLFWKNNVSLTKYKQQQQRQQQYNNNNK